MEEEKPVDPSFEVAFNQLEDTVARLESGGLSIEDMVARFEEGMALVKLCYQKLDGAQARVQVLIRDEAEAEGLEQAGDNRESTDERV